jgi:hypothetical protein
MKENETIKLLLQLAMRINLENLLTTTKLMSKLTSFILTIPKFTGLSKYIN